LKRNENLGCLNWVAGAAGIAGLIYFIVDATSLAPWLIETVAFQSAWMLNLFTGVAQIEGVHIIYNGEYAVSIIFACTGVQSIVLFVGMIVPLTKVDKKRKLYGLLVTIVPIYFLNLLRNALIAYLMGTNATTFFMAHNVIGKGGSLVVLVVLLFIVIKIVPELFDDILSLVDLPKRNGPLEIFFKKLIWRKN